MKRIILLFLTICMGFMVACNSTQAIEKKIPKYGIQTDDAFRIWNKNIDKTNNNETVPENVLKISENSELGKRIHELGTDIVTYINEVYGTRWVYEYVVIGMYDFSNTEFSKYNAYYSTEDYVLYLNSDYQYDASGINYIVTHELIHYIRQLNIGTADFQYDNTNGLGNFMMEALTDLLTIELFNETEDVQKFFINNSSYCYSVVSMQILQLSIPSLMKYYLENDMDSLEKEFNELSNKYVDYTGTTVDNPFINYLDIIDASQVAYNAMSSAYIANNSAFLQFGKIHHNYELGQYELSLLLLRESETEIKKKAISYINVLYSEEMKNEDESYFEEFIFFESCVN